MNTLASWENMAPLYFPIATVHCLVNVIVGLNISSADQNLSVFLDHIQPVKQEAQNSRSHFFCCHFFHCEASNDPLEIMQTKG